MTKTKPFNIAEARAGAKVVTKSGLPVELMLDTANEDSIYVVVGTYLANGRKWLGLWKQDGNADGMTTDLDLLLVAPERYALTQVDRKDYTSGLAEVDFELYDRKAAEAVLIKTRKTKAAIAGEFPQRIVDALNAYDEDKFIISVDRNVKEDRDLRAENMRQAADIISLQKKINKMDQVIENREAEISALRNNLEKRDEVAKAKHDHYKDLGSELDIYRKGSTSIGELLETIATLKESNKDLQDDLAQAVNRILTVEKENAELKEIDQKWRYVNDENNKKIVALEGLLLAQPPIQSIFGKR